MSRPLFLVEALPAGDRYRLDGAEGRHAATVQRLRTGEELLISDGVGGLARCVVTAADRDGLDLRVLDVRVEPAPDPRLVVAQALPKGDRAELAVQAMTEVGVDEIVPWQATRSVVQWRGERGARSLAKWWVTAREAAKQSRRARVPVVADVATTAAVASRATLVLHEDATVPLSTVDLPATGEIVVVVGPEGGITEAELLAFDRAVTVRLGPTVLRTSTAGVAALSVLAARLGRW